MFPKGKLQANYRKILTSASVIRFKPTRSCGSAYKVEQQRTVVVIENSFYINAIAYRLKEEGADLGHDIRFDALLREAALCMIDHAPINANS